MPALSSAWGKGEGRGERRGSGGGVGEGRSGKRGGRREGYVVRVESDVLLRLLYNSTRRMWSMSLGTQVGYIRYHEHVHIHIHNIHSLCVKGCQVTVAMEYSAEVCGGVE